MVATEDNLMVVILRDSTDEGCHIAWSPAWLKKCKTEPLSLLKTISALSLAMNTFANMLHNDVDDIIPMPTGPVN